MTRFSKKYHTDGYNNSEVDESVADTGRHMKSGVNDGRERTIVPPPRRAGTNLVVGQDGERVPPSIASSPRCNRDDFLKM